MGTESGGQGANCTCRTIFLKRVGVGGQIVPFEICKTEALCEKDLYNYITSIIMEPKVIYTDLGGGRQAFFQTSHLTNKSNLTRVTNFKKETFFSLKQHPQQTYIFAY